MRGLRTLFACTAWIGTAAACGGGGAHSPLAPSNGARPPVTLKVMTFNIQHGIDGSDRYNLQRAIDTVASAQPDIVGLQEVTRNHPFYDCDDQPAKIAAGVGAATGMLWTIAYRQEWFTPDVSCQASGRGDGPETEGLAILTRRQVSGSTVTALPDSRLGLEVTVHDAYELPFVVTHLTAGASASGIRMQQIGTLLSWAGAFGSPRVMVGDFNAAPGSAEAQSLTAYHDAWADALTLGHATGAGASHGATRIDYVFYLPGSTLFLQSVSTLDTAAIFGVAASDHSPVIATFTVR
jgi:endonuclease/exonuclease/phosphatase family metal-dependent hydrolase